MSKITPEQKEFFSERRKLQEKRVLHNDPFKNYIVEKHIKGSLYRLIGPDNIGHVFASHDLKTDVWKLWI